MSTETEQQNIEANLKAQKEAEDRQFKRMAKDRALTLAYENSPAISDTLAEADKICQWLIKDL